MKSKLAQNINTTLQDYLQKEVDEKYDQSYLGVVEDNMDPLKIGRVRVRLHGLYDDIPTAALPWSTPNFPLGAGGVKGSFIVPEIGAVINVTFDDGDIYEPKYDSKCLDIANLDFDADKDEDYPNSVIFYETSNGDYCKVNRKTGEYTLKTGSGVFFKMCQDGSIILSNESSEGGSLQVSLIGDIDIDNRAHDYYLTTNNKMVSAFGDLVTKANGGILEECLDDRETYTNHDNIQVAGNDTSIKSKNLIELGSMKTKVRSNEFSIVPAKESSTGFSLSICEDTTQTPFMSVDASPLGGPFNAIMFDPFTGQPHQGRVVSSIAIGPSSDTDIIEQKLKITTQVTAKYAKILKRELDSISAQFTSIDMQAQMLINTLNSTTYLIDMQATKIEETTTYINGLRDAELERRLNAIDGYLTTPIFEDEQANKTKYEDKILAAEIIAKADITHKTTYKDLLGAGDGIVRDNND